jgi:hypothetical protein
MHPERVDVKSVLVSTPLFQARFTDIVFYKMEDVILESCFHRRLVALPPRYRGCIGLFPRNEHI